MTTEEHPVSKPWQEQLAATLREQTEENEESE